MASGDDAGSLHAYPDVGDASAWVLCAWAAGGWRTCPGGQELCPTGEALGRACGSSQGMPTCSCAHSMLSIDSAHSQYLTHFALAGDEHVYEHAFPKTMSWPFRHTSRYRCLSHARAMVRLRCCSTPLAACPTNRSATLRVCPRCTLGVDQTAEHMLLDCPSTAPARASAHFAPLFTPPAAGGPYAHPNADGPPLHPGKLCA